MPAQVASPAVYTNCHNCHITYLKNQVYLDPLLRDLDYLIKFNVKSSMVFLMRLSVSAFQQVFTLFYANYARRIDRVRRVTVTVVRRSDSKSKSEERTGLEE